MILPLELDAMSGGTSFVGSSALCKSTAVFLFISRLAEPQSLWAWPPGGASCADADGGRDRDGGRRNAVNSAKHLPV